MNCYVEIGRIDFSKIYNLDCSSIAGIKFSQSIGKCSVIIYTKEQLIPHIHIKSLNTDFETSIQLFDSKYYTHGNKYGKLSNRQCRILDKWFNKRNKITPELTNWEKCKIYWKDLKNPLLLFSEKYNKPDYSNIKEL